MKRKAIKKHKSSKGLLVRGYLENVSSGLFEVIEDKISELLKRQSGIYVLYKNNTIYYIGLAKGLRGRIRGHLEDRHKNKWNRFSLYIIKKTNYLKDLESLLLRLVKPKGNKIKGCFKKQGNLNPTVKKALSAVQRVLDKAS